MSCRQLGVTVITLEQFVRTFHAPYLPQYRALGITASYEQISQWYKEHAKHEDAPMFSDVQTTLEHLREHMAIVGIVTVQREEVARRICNSYGIRHHFKYMVGWAEDKVTAIQQFREDYWYIPDNKFYFVGDFPSDMRDAKRAGMCDVGITRGYPTRNLLLAAGAEVCIDHLLELLAVTCCKLRSS